MNNIYFVVEDLFYIKDTELYNWNTNSKFARKYKMLSIMLIKNPFKTMFGGIVNELLKLTMIAFSFTLLIRFSQKHIICKLLLRLGDKNDLFY